MPGTGIGRVQSVDATPACWSERRCSSNASAGVRQSRIFRGRELSSAATASRSPLVHLERSVPFGKYWRNSPLVFSLVPRCQGLRGSVKNTGMPVSTLIANSVGGEFFAAVPGERTDELVG